MVPIKSGPSHPDPALAGTLSVFQLARRWHIPRRQVLRLLGRQEVTFVQIRGSFRIPVEEIERYERHGPKTAAPRRTS